MPKFAVLTPRTPPPPPDPYEGLDLHVHEQMKDKAQSQALSSPNSQQRLEQLIKKLRAEINRRTYALRPSLKCMFFTWLRTSGNGCCVTSQIPEVRQVKCF